MIKQQRLNPTTQRTQRRDNLQKTVGMSGRVKLPKYLDAVRSYVTHCVKCGTTEQLEVAHYSGLYSDRLGNGMASKSHDYCVARLCKGCHGDFDGYVGDNDDARALDFVQAINRTMLTLWHIWLNSTPKPKDIDEQLKWLGDVNQELDWKLWQGHSATEIIEFLAQQRDYIAERGK